MTENEREVIEAAVAWYQWAKEYRHGRHNVDRDLSKAVKAYLAELEQFAKPAKPPGHT